MSICHSIKQEYETLKDLTQEFVSSCEKAGDPRALSADQLRTLQIQKQKLEQARNTLEHKFETEEHRIWKKVYDATLSCLYVQNFPGSYARSIQELISTEALRLNFVKNVMSNIEVGQQDPIAARNAVQGIHSGVSLGVFSEKEMNKIRDSMKTKAFEQTFSHGMYSSLQRKREDDLDILIALKSAFNAIEIGLLPKEAKGMVLSLIPELSFERGSDPVQGYERPVRTILLEEMDDLNIVMSLPSLYAFGLLRREEKKRLQDRIAKHVMVDRSDLGIGESADRGRFLGSSAHDALAIVTTLKDLVELSRIRRKK